MPLPRTVTFEPFSHVALCAKISEPDTTSRSPTLENAQFVITRSPVPDILSDSAPVKSEVT